MKVSIKEGRFMKLNMGFGQVFSIQSFLYFC